MVPCSKHGITMALFSVKFFLKNLNVQLMRQIYWYDQSSSNQNWPLFFFQDSTSSRKLNTEYNETLLPSWIPLQYYSWSCDIGDQIENAIYCAVFDEIAPKIAQIAVIFNITASLVIIVMDHVSKKICWCLGLKSWQLGIGPSGPLCSYLSSPGLFLTCIEMDMILKMNYCNATQFE